MKVELPDMKREDIKITFENNVLTIEGERKVENRPRKPIGIIASSAATARSVAASRCRRRSMRPKCRPPIATAC